MLKELLVSHDVFRKKISLMYKIDFKLKKKQGCSTLGKIQSVVKFHNWWQRIL